MRNTPEDHQVYNCENFLKYMVSLRCKMLVKTELEKLGLGYKIVELGEVELTNDISSKTWNELNTALKRSGIELMQNQKSILIEKIKNIIVELVHYAEEPLEINLSAYISQKLHHDYTYLANLFSETQGVTIEHFYIIHRVERIKELLIYDELSISEIAWKMNYSSVGHLSVQFKKITGLTPSFFKKIKDKKRRGLEDI